MAQTKTSRTASFFTILIIKGNLYGLEFGQKHYEDL